MRDPLQGCRAATRETANARTPSAATRKVQTKAGDRFLSGIKLKRQPAVSETNREEGPIHWKLTRGIPVSVSQYPTTIAVVSP